MIKDSIPMGADFPQPSAGNISSKSQSGSVSKSKTFPIASGAQNIFYSPKPVVDREYFQNFGRIHFFHRYTMNFE